MDGRKTDPAGRLREHGLRPRKRLGQNFLRDRRFLDHILNAAEIDRDDAVLEVGAGTGVLTRAVAERAGSVLAVELDDSLAALLQDEFADSLTVRIWHGNALDLDPCQHFTGPYTLVGNIPYYITGPILRHFLESRCQPARLVLMVQREVAQRMSARPGELSLLGVSVQLYAEPRVITRVPAGAFYPPPRVESAIVRLQPRPHELTPAEVACFFQVARAGFGTKRKTLANALQIGLGVTKETATSLLGTAQIHARTRAQDLSLEDWKRLARTYCRSGIGT